MQNFCECFKEPKHTSATQCRFVNLAASLHCSPSRNSSSSCQSWSGAHAWSWRSAVRNTYSLLRCNSPPQTMCACAVQTLNVNHAIAHKGWTKGQRLRSRAAAVACVFVLCVLCARTSLSTQWQLTYSRLRFSNPTRREKSGTIPLNGLCFEPT